MPPVTTAPPTRAEPAVDRTTPPAGGKPVLLYDGACRFCIAGASRLARRAPTNALELVDFNQPGALDPFPGVTPEACRRSMHLVRADGRVFRGVGAAIEVYASRGIVGRLARVYYVPGVRQLMDGAYRIIAANRYRIMGRVPSTGACDTGACAPHGPR